MERYARRLPAPRQGGTVIPLVAGAMVAILGAAALALDLGHAYVSKTQLQNALDAAALSGAKVLDQTASTSAAENEVRANFTQNANFPENAVLREQAAEGNLTLTVEFSSTLVPFSPGTTPPHFIRVRGNAMQLPSWFARVVGLDEMTVNGSAVAGPSPKLDHVCNIVPVMMCGDMSATDGFYGYQPGTDYTLKLAAGDDSDVGPGNFRLIRLDGLTGGADIRDAMAGSYEHCLSTSDEIETEPGNKVGPVVQGLNTRLGINSGPMSSYYRPDLVSRHPGIDYGDYLSAYAAKNFDHPDGEAERRILAVPFGDCTEDVTGQGSLPLLGFGCFFLTDRVVQRGNEADITGEFIRECNARGFPGPIPTTGPGPHIIQLYKDPANVDA